MNYKDMTKAELIEKLEEQKHLASAIEAKDIEMSQLKNKKDEEVKKLRENLQELRKELVGKIPKQQAEEMVNNALKDAEKTVQIANEFLAANKNSLQLMNAALKIINHNDKLLNEKLDKN